MSNRLDQPQERNLFEELLALRDRQREARAGARCVVRGKDVPLELNQWGLVQWYLHPGITDVVSRAMILWALHIPPGSRTGKLHAQGGHIYLVWKGTRGHTILDGVRHDWARGCVINIPMGPRGAVFQHFNDGDDELVLVGCEENVVDSLGVDRGSGFEVLEPCPEWAAKFQRA